MESWTVETVRTSSGLCHKIGPLPSRGRRRPNHACVYDDYPTHPGGTPELVRSARMLGAAPDMLALLEAMLEAVHAVGEQPIMAWRGAIVAALQKAKAEE